MNKHFDQLFSKYGFGFCQGYGNGNKALDKSGLGVALLAHLPKAFNSIKHNLLIAKVAARGLDYQHGH